MKSNTTNIYMHVYRRRKSITGVSVAVSVDNKHGCGKWGCKDKRNLSFGMDSGHKTSLQLPCQLSAQYILP